MSSCFVCFPAVFPHMYMYLINKRKYTNILILTTATYLKSVTYQDFPEANTVNKIVPLLFAVSETQGAVFHERLWIRC